MVAYFYPTHVSKASRVTRWREVKQSEGQEPSEWLKEEGVAARYVCG